MEEGTRRKYTKALGLVEVSARDARRALTVGDTVTAAKELRYLKAHDDLLSELLVQIDGPESAA